MRPLSPSAKQMADTWRTRARCAAPSAVRHPKGGGGLADEARTSANRRGGRWRTDSQLTIEYEHPTGDPLADFLAYKHTAQPYDPRRAPIPY